MFILNASHFLHSLCDFCTLLVVNTSTGCVKASVIKVPGPLRLGTLILL